MRRISIVICTYERPRLLAAALASVFALEGLDRATLDVVVVDNSDGGSARSVVEALAGSAPVGVTYREAHPANISVARNVGVAATDAEIVALIDDDQEVARGWLTAVLDGVDRYPHDVFFGPIAPRFETDAAATPEARAMFTRASPAAAGSALAATGRSRQPFPLSTANSIFRRVGTLDGEAPFDPRLGQCGGEDLHLFCRLEKAGCRFGWLPDAPASDFVPARRCSFSYLTARHYAGGQVFAAAVVWSSSTPLRDRALIVAKALVQIACFPLSAAVGIARRRSSGAMMALRFAGLCGKISWRNLHPLYRAENRTVSEPCSST